MIQPKRPVLNGNPLSSWMTKTVNSLESNPIISNDLDIQQTANGKRINLRNSIIPGLRFSKWDENFGYSVGELVYTEDWYDVDDTYVSPRAWWICEYSVPIKLDLNVIPTPDNRAEIGSFLESLNGRNDKIIYRPIIRKSDGKEPDRAPMESDNPDEQCRYWRLFSLLPQTMYVCEDNESVQYFVTATKLSS